MKIVSVSKYGMVNGLYQKVEDGQGIFHEWGVGFEEIGDNVGNYSTAIIERGDGTIENVSAELIQFIHES